MIRDTPLLPIDAATSIGPVTPHPEYSSLRTALTAAINLVTAHADHYFRTSAPPYITPATFFSGLGAARAGNRWNPPGIHTVYLSATPELAVTEYLAAGRNRGTPDHESLPVTTEAAKVTISRCLDLRTPAVKKALGIDFAALVNEDFYSAAVRGCEARCQAFGRAAHAAGIQAIIVPSRVQPTLHNIAVYRTLLSHQETCDALHPGLLPPDIK